MKQLQLLDLIEHTVFACGVEHVRICADGAAHIPAKRAANVLTEAVALIYAEVAARVRAEEGVHILAEGAAHIHSYRSDKQVVIYGYCNTPPTNSYGIVDNGELYSLLTNPSLSLVNQNKNLLTFKNAKTGNSMIYSFVSKKRIDELLPSVEPKSKFNFDATASLLDDFVEKLKQQAKIIGEDDYGLFSVESYINFRMGDWDATVLGNILLPAKYSSFFRWQWDTDLLIKILSQSGDYKLAVSSEGYMGIECKTEFAKYVYILPALMK
jgi:hypothetical protein